MTPTQKAVEIAESLHSVNNADAVRDNVEMICSIVVDALESIAGSQRWQRSYHQNETIEFWKKAGKEGKKLKF